MVACPFCTHEMQDSKFEELGSVDYSRLIGRFISGNLGRSFMNEMHRKSLEKIPITIFYCDKCHSMIFSPKVWQNPPNKKD